MQNFTREEKYFYLRRLHSLSGFIPIGLYFLFHLFANAKITRGKTAYNQMISDIASIPYLPFIEIAVIAIPLLFHIILGISIYLSSKNNVLQYPNSGNWRFFFQRLTGLIGLVYIAYHVWQTRFGGEHVSYELMEKIVRAPGMFWFYLVGAISLTFHFANGLWTFLITWGITVSPRSQKLSGFLCVGLFVALSLAWAHILITLRYPHLLNFLK